jgi:hypothetical protein
LKNLKGRNYFENLGIYGRKILKWSILKQGVKVLSSMYDSCEHNNEISCSISSPFSWVIFNYLSYHLIKVIIKTFNYIHLINFFIYLPLAHHLTFN